MYVSSEISRLGSHENIRLNRKRRNRKLNYNSCFCLALLRWVLLSWYPFHDFGKDKRIYSIFWFWNWEVKNIKHDTFQIPLVFPCLPRWPFLPNLLSGDSFVECSFFTGILLSLVDVLSVKNSISDVFNVGCVLVIKVNSLCCWLVFFKMLPCDSVFSITLAVYTCHCQSWLIAYFDYKLFGSSLGIALWLIWRLSWDKQFIKNSVCMWL